MEIDKFKLISHLLFFCDLISCFYYLSWKSCFLVFVFLYQSFLLPVFFFKKFLYSLCLDVSCSTVLPSHQDFSLKIISVFSYLSYCHVCFLQYGSESLEDGVWLNPTFLDSILEWLSLLLCNLILFLWSEVEIASILIFLALFFLLLIVILILVLFFKTYEVWLKEIVLSPEMLNILEVSFELLWQLFDGE